MELEDNYRKVQLENIRLDVGLKHEKDKTDMLQRDLVGSQKVCWAILVDYFVLINNTY